MLPYMNPFNVGYGGAGGSLTSQALAGFNSWSSTATIDLLPTRMILVSRARQLVISHPTASASINRMVGGIIGTGLTYAYPTDSEYINEPYDYSNISFLIKKQLNLASQLHLLDAQKRQTFNQIQELACRNWLLSGDVFFVRRFRDGLSSWRAVECDRCQSPYYYAKWDDCGNELCVNPSTGNRIVDGVELDGDSIPVAYWFLKDYITQPLSVTDEQIERIPAKDHETDQPLVLHLFKPLRPDQYRGIPILADQIESLHSTKNYVQAELQAAQFQSAIWGFLTSQNPTYDETEPLSSRDLDEKIPTEPKTQSTPTTAPTMQLSSDFAEEMDRRIVSETMFPKPKVVSAGQLWHLKEGEDVKFLQSTHPNSNFESFVKAQNNMTASAIGLPRQVLECNYDGTYASARGSVLEANETYKKYRSYFIESFIKPVFQVFVYETLKEYGADDDDCEYLSQAMSLESIWQAPTALCLDPTKEVDAWAKAIQLGLVDRDEASRALYGHKATGTPETPNKTVEIEEI